MKHLPVLFSIFAGAFLASCGSKTATNEPVNSTTEEKTQLETIEKKNLITNTSVGYFVLDSAWQNVAKKEYTYQFIESMGSCVDACCDGGFLLGYNDANNTDKTIIDKEELTIGAALFSDDDSEKKYKTNKDVFYVASDNCSGWYWKDKISYIVILSPLYKTQEGIGIGSTLETVESKFGKLSFNIGWVEEDPNAVQIEIEPYPSVEFILDIDDYKKNWEDISLSGTKNKIQLSDFNANTEIKRIVVGRKKSNE